MHMICPSMPIPVSTELTEVLQHGRIACNAEPMQTTVIAMTIPPVRQSVFLYKNYRIAIALDDCLYQSH